jgi:hypothetical protein
MCIYGQPGYIWSIGATLLCEAHAFSDFAHEDPQVPVQLSAEQCT